MRPELRPLLSALWPPVLVPHGAQYKHEFYGILSDERFVGTLIGNMPAIFPQQVADYLMKWFSEDGPLSAHGAIVASEIDGLAAFTGPSAFGDYLDAHILQLADPLKWLAANPLSELPQGACTLHVRALVCKLTAELLFDACIAGGECVRCSVP